LPIVCRHPGFAEGEDRDPESPTEPSLQASGTRPRASASAAPQKIKPGKQIRPGPQQAYDPCVTYSLLRPPEGMTGFLRLIWPLVYVQLIALKAWMHKTYGPGVPYWYTVSHWGKVSLRHMPLDLAERGYAAHCALKPLAFDFALFNAPTRLALALTPETRTLAPTPQHEDEAYSAYVLSEISLTDTS
jgi:hypothetical protein